MIFANNTKNQSKTNVINYECIFFLTKNFA